ncbi:MAG TPA: DUF6491 family protein [Arenimonas sp.]|nr:DUF6491 family protein [Arenimonas sp.]HPW31822.1 DUF6491 family protein [Arenimonas sp.]
MKRLLVLCLGFLLIAACSSPGFTRDRDYSERLALVARFAGKPVPYVRFGLPKIAYDWEPLGDTAVLVWHTRSKAYLVDLEKSDSCRDIDREMKIRLDGNINDLDARNGYIELRNGGWCKMTQIRPVDVAGLKQAEKSKTQ